MPRHGEGLREQDTNELHVREKELTE